MLRALSRRGRARSSGRATWGSFAVGRTLRHGPPQGHADHPRRQYYPSDLERTVRGQPPRDPLHGGVRSSRWRSRSAVRKACRRAGGASRSDRSGRPRRRCVAAVRRRSPRTTRSSARRGCFWSARAGFPRRPAGRSSGSRCRPRLSTANRGVSLNGTVTARSVGQQ